MTNQKAQGTTSAAPSSVPLHRVGVRLDERDDVAVAKEGLKRGTAVTWQEKGIQREIVLRDSVPAGHKMALRDIRANDRVLRYGQVIGFATQDIAAGEHVHTHNLGLGEIDRECAPRLHAEQRVRPVTVEPHTFNGYPRADGRVGTRNYIAVIATVNCSAHICHQIAQRFTSGRLERYPNIDGVLALTHHSGCAQRKGGMDYVLLQRTLCGMARHPNVAACIFVGLGCETNQTADLLAECGFPECDAPPTLVVQELGGTRRTIEKGIETVEALLPGANAVERTPVPISELTLALQCGGSDSWSGVTANPTVGLVSDELVRQGGTVVLAETPEIVGAEHLLTHRAVNRAVARDLIEVIGWWEKRTKRQGIELDDNRSAGNEAGGLTTVYEKALGGVAKSGSSPLAAVYDYAEPVADRGLAFMNTPGFDPVSVTGQIAGGCNLVVFTTGRGSVFGSVPAPSIKVSTNSRLYEHMADDIDLNAGQILQGVEMADVAAQLLELVVAVASGQQTKSETQGKGEAEFSPWNLGGTL